MREARKYFGFTSWFLRVFRRVAGDVPLPLPVKRALHGSRKASASCLRKTGRRGRRPLPCAYGALHFFGLHHPGEDGTKMGSIFSYHVLRCASFPSLPPVKTGQKWDPFLSLTSTRQWSGWKCCSCFIASKGAYDILRTVAMADERSPRNPRDTSCGSQRQFAYYMRRKPPGRSQDGPLI